MNTWRFLAKTLVHGAMDLSGRPQRGRRRMRGKLIVLTYHSFCNEWPRGLFSSLPIERFEKQLRFLRRHFDIVDLAQGRAYLEEGRTADRPWVAITIDDGFRDNYTHAWPVLRRYAVPATVFLATDFIDTGRPPWPTQLIEIIERARVSDAAPPLANQLSNRATRAQLARALKAEWRTLPPQDRWARLVALRRQLKVGDDNHYPPLTWQQMREMQAGGIRFGSHTVHHSLLPHVSDDVVIAEVRASKQRIEAMLQTPCDAFAYPNGDHDARTRAFVAAERYRMALTQDAGANDATADTLALRRVEIPYHDPLSTYRVRVSGGLWPAAILPS